MKRSHALRLAILLSLAIPLLGLISCSEGDVQTIRDLALEWASAHAVDVAKYVVWGESGDSEVDAVMGAKSVIDNINQADQLMQEGRLNHDLDKMDQAVKKRGGDYTYRVSYGVELLRQGQTDQALGQFEAGDAAVDDYGPAHGARYAIQAIDELGALQDEFDQRGFANADQCRAYYGQLSHYYGLRHTQTGQSYFQEQKDHFAELAGACR